MPWAFRADDYLGCRRVTSQSGVVVVVVCATAVEVAVAVSIVAAAQRAIIIYYRGGLRCMLGTGSDRHGRSFCISNRPGSLVMRSCAVQRAAVVASYRARSAVPCAHAGALDRYSNPIDRIQAGESSRAATRLRGGDRRQGGDLEYMPCRFAVPDPTLSIVDRSSYSVTTVIGYRRRCRALGGSSDTQYIKLAELLAACRLDNGGKCSGASVSNQEISTKAESRLRDPRRPSARRQRG